MKSAHLDSSAAKHFVSRRQQRGVNLIEVMVSMVIGLFLVLGATTLYVNSKKSADVDDSVAHLQESARYAMSILETDIRMANDWGMQKDGSSFVNNALAKDYTAIAAAINGTGANNCGINYVLDASNPIAATNNSYTFPSATCGARYNAATTADTLTIRRASASAKPGDATKIQLCSSRTITFIIFDGGAGCADEVHDLINNIYYVDQSSDQSATVPSLRRHALIAGPTFNDVEIMPGVEDMQIQLGWVANCDPSKGTCSPNAVEYLQPGTPPPVATPLVSYVVAVRVWLLVRAETADLIYQDSNTYEYGDRAVANGTTTTLNAAGAANKAYAPADKFRRLLVSRTFFVRNVVGT